MHEMIEIAQQKEQIAEFEAQLAELEALFSESRMRVKHMDRYFEENRDELNRFVDWSSRRAQWRGQ